MFSSSIPSQVPQPTQEVTFMAVGEPDYTIPYLPFLIIILYIGWSGVTGTTRKADGAAYHGKELPTDTAFKIFTTICWSMLGITDRGSKEI